MVNIKEFSNEIKAELKKVVWPSKDSTIGTTAVVIVICLIFAVYLGVVDYGLSKLSMLIY